MFRRHPAATVAAVIAVVVAVIFWGHIASSSQMFFGFRNGDGNGSHYLFFSGSGSDLAYLSFVAGAVTLYRRHNCAKEWCPRIGKYELADPETGVKRMLCWRHHPDVHHKALTLDHIQQIQHKRHLYLGKQPGKG